MGLKIRHLREEKKITLSELGQRTGISVSYLNEIEKGKKHPKPSKAALIAEALGTTYDKLVSLQLDKKLKPIAQLLGSQLLHDLHLEYFGLDTAMLMENFAAAPDKLTAILSTIGEIARRSDIDLEAFYMATLRTYQEMHLNYFPELEQQAEAMEGLLGYSAAAAHSTQLFASLQSLYGITVVEDLHTTPGLEGLRSLLLPAAKQLRINARLSETQRRFVAARELAFQCMGITERPLTSAWVKISHLEMLLNNFRGSYVAGALLLPQDDMVEQLQQLFAQKTWQARHWEEVVQAARVSPEMYLHRATSILPRFFGIQQLFFLKFEHDTTLQEIELTKELHLGGLHHPHAKAGREHYCRRWISITLLQELAERQKAADAPPYLTGLQRSLYADGNQSYMVLSMARSFSPSPSRNSSISLGLPITDTLQERIAFLSSKKLPEKMVSNTCERCPLPNCAERMAPPQVLHQQQRQLALEAALDEVLNTGKR